MSTRAELYAALAGETPTDSDFLVNHQASIALLTPRTDEAQDWLEEHLTGEVSWSGGAVVVEARYLEPLLDGIAGDGFSVHFY